MRISDWSSDVCSSDLFIRAARNGFPVVIRCGFVAFDGANRAYGARTPAVGFEVKAVEAFSRHEHSPKDLGSTRPESPGWNERANEIGRATCRERVCQYV